MFSFPSKTLLLAGNHREAATAVLHVLHVHPKTILSVSAPHQLRGWDRGSKIYLYGTYYARKDYLYFAELIRDRELKVEYLYDRDLGADTVPHPLGPGYP